MKLLKLGVAAAIIVSLISLAWYFVRQGQFLLVGAPTALLLIIVFVMILRQEQADWALSNSCLLTNVAVLANKLDVIRSRDR